MLDRTAVDLADRPPKRAAVALPQQRARVLAGCAVLALALHAAFFGSFDVASFGEREPAPAMSVRTVPLAPVLEAIATPAAAADATTPPAIAAVAPVAPPLPQAEAQAQPQPHPQAPPQPQAQAQAQAQAQSRPPPSPAPRQARRTHEPQRAAPPREAVRIAIDRGADSSDAGAIASTPIAPSPLPATPLAVAVAVAVPAPAGPSIEDIAGGPGEVAPGLIVAALASPPAASAASPAAASAPSLLAAGELPPPLYRTRLPPAATLRYEVRRGLLRGTGEIRWQPSGPHYRLILEARIAGLTLLTQTSTGEIDGHGLAPVRFLDQRARRAAQAANFRRDEGRITFSGTGVEWPLLAGSQDRLSWMIQLPGIVAADPERLVGDARIAMVVVGARGDAGVWTLRYAGRDDVETPAGTVHALRLVRDARSVSDTSAEIWLDPQRSYLPARALLRNSSGGVEYDLLLEGIEPG